MTNEYFGYKELLLPPVHRAAYSDRMAWLMAEMSKLAYLQFEKDKKTEEELRAELARANFTLIKWFSKEGTQAFLAKRESDKITVLSFRGTETNGFNVETLLDVFSDVYATMRIDENNVKTHKGFFSAFQKVKTEILEQLRPLTDYSLYITGHSLGGALALMATREVNSDSLGACYTFGSPKVGNEEFDDEIKAPIYRIVNSFDIVPFLPFTQIMLLLLSLTQKIKNKKVKILIENFKEYQHHGDIRFLTNAKSDNDVKVLNEYDEVKRSLQLLKFTFTTNKNIGVEHHSLDAYREKLAQWALKRL